MWNMCKYLQWCSAFGSTLWVKMQQFLFNLFNLFFLQRSQRSRWAEFHPPTDERQHGSGRMLLARSHFCFMSYFLSLLLRVSPPCIRLNAAVQGRSSHHMEAEGAASAQTSPDAQHSSKLRWHLDSLHHSWHWIAQRVYLILHDWKCFFHAAMDRINTCSYLYVIWWYNISLCFLSLCNQQDPVFWSYSHPPWPWFLITITVLADPDQKTTKHS